MMKIGFTDESYGEGGPASVLSALEGRAFSVEWRGGNLANVELIKARETTAVFDGVRDLESDPARWEIDYDDITELTYL